MHGKNTKGGTFSFTNGGNFKMPASQLVTVANKKYFFHVYIMVARLNILCQTAVILIQFTYLFFAKQDDFGNFQC
mgnify:CR=1 FL=1